MEDTLKVQIVDDLANKSQNNVDKKNKNLRKIKERSISYFQQFIILTFIVLAISLLIMDFY